MTFYKILDAKLGLTFSTEDANDVSKGFRFTLGGTTGTMSLDDARELAEYIWVRLPGYGEELTDEQV